MGNASELYTSTGFGPIDDEHEALSLALTAFVEKVNAEKGQEIRQSLDGVIRAVADHFAHEEALMAEHAYPQLNRHAEAHRAFVADARKFQAEFERTGVTPEFRRWAVRRLPEWFRYHILAHDMGLAQFLVKAGVLPEIEVVVS